jgi:hypothetical protein
MAGFEVIVRPAVLPNIRPASARVLPPQDNPEQGICTISGGGGGLIDLSYTFSASFSSNAPAQESKRQVDKERVHQVTTDAGGASIMHQDNYVEVERLKRVRLETPSGPIKVRYADPPKVDNVVTIETDITR